MKPYLLLEVGRTYLTRGGDVATITGYDDQTASSRVWDGHIGTRQFAWTAAGRAEIARETKYDLVSYLPEIPCENNITITVPTGTNVEIKYV